MFYAVDTLSEPEPPPETERPRAKGRARESERQREKKNERKRETEISGRAIQSCSLTLSADVTFKKKAFSGPNRIKQPAVESVYTTTMVSIHPPPQHNSFFHK